MSKIVRESLKAGASKLLIHKSLADLFCDTKIFAQYLRRVEGVLQDPLLPGRNDLLQLKSSVCLDLTQRELLEQCGLSTCSQC